MKQTKTKKENNWHKPHFSNGYNIGISSIDFGSTKTYRISILPDLVFSFTPDGDWFNNIGISFRFLIFTGWVSYLWIPKRLRTK